MRIFLLILFLMSSAVLFAQDAEKKLKELKIELFQPKASMGAYVKAVRSGNLIYLSGHGPQKADGTFLTGKVGQDAKLQDGYMAAYQTAIAMLSSLKAELGDLNKVKRIVKVFGMVNCTPEFTDQPKVINGFSELMINVFGEKGMHARSAIGVNALPANMMVEVEMIVEVTE